MPAQGSVGASGDLAPLAHLALPLIGRGEVEFDGQVMPAPIALREAGLEPLTLEPKEGLALLNGTQLMTALGALVAADAERLLRDGERGRGDVGRGAARAPTSRSPRRTSSPARTRARSRSRPSCGTSCAAPGSSSPITRSAHKVQDPYSLRCVPQVHGAVRDALDHLRRVLDIELNAATDNPLVFPDGGVADGRARRPAAGS